MSCHGLCHRCPCTDDLIGDMERSLSSMINGLERYLDSICPHSGQFALKAWGSLFTFCPGPPEWGFLF
jgi:hypothetical protein